MTFCGKGLGNLPPADSVNLYQEGREMVRGLANQLAAGCQFQVTVASSKPLELDPGCQNIVTVGGGSDGAESDEAGDSFAELSRLASSFPATLLIAPENKGIAETCCHAVAATDSTLLSPSAAFVALCTDKLATTCMLHRQGVPTPRSIDDGHRLQSPRLQVLKPRRDAGSRVTILPAEEPIRFDPANEVVEPWIEGTPVSVSVIAGPNQTVYLPATEQLFAPATVAAPRGWQTQGRYIGSRPLDDPAQLLRARELARRTLQHLPPFRGYIGLDMVLAAPPRPDTLIEVNPRLTSSFVQLQQMLPINLAESILRVARGDRITVA